MAIRRHYAVALAKVKGGWRVERAIEYPSRAEAEKMSLTLLGRHGDAEVLTVEDREIDRLTAREKTLTAPRRLPVQKRR